MVSYASSVSRSFLDPVHAPRAPTSLDVSGFETCSGYEAAERARCLDFVDPFAQRRQFCLQSRKRLEIDLRLELETDLTGVLGR